MRRLSLRALPIVLLLAAIAGILAVTQPATTRAAQPTAAQPTAAQPTAAQPTAAQPTAQRPTAHAATSTTASSAPAVAATNRLALSLLPRVGGSGNAVFSPYSIEAALAMVDQGAAGQTAAQIDKVLGASSPAALAQAAPTLTAQLQKAAGTGSGAAVLDSAASLWLQSGFPIEGAFQRTLNSGFDAPPTTLNFATNPSAAAQQIDQWVATHTHNLIPQLLTPQALAADTKLVLVTALYLSAHWQTPFQAQATHNATFTEADGTHVSTPFMATGSPIGVPYAATSAYDAVDLPYKNSTLSMLAVMPAAGTLPAFERGLTQAKLQTLIGGMHQRLLNLQMPKLKLSLRIQLNGALAALGMPQAFSNDADFSRISRKVRLMIADAQHQAVMKVDENGTTAAAATSISITPTAIAVSPLSLDLTRPYLLFLRDDRTGTILFAARVNNPASS
jgi:serpin B